MGVKAFLSKPLASWVVRQQDMWMREPVVYQDRMLKQLLSKGAQTTFGKDHRLKDVHNYKEYKEAVPIRDYEALVPYVDQILAGGVDILWPGKPAYFAKTSGTTSGAKFIPITGDALPNHINSARNALLSYINDTGNSKFLDGKLIFLSGSPTLDYYAGIPTGRLSGIVNHHVPQYLRKNQLPDYATNCEEDWEKKLALIVAQTFNENMTLISGIPPWVQMYFDQLAEKAGGKKIKDIFPNFSLFIYGGVNFEPYRNKLYESIGRKVDSIETYPASEGFIAYQDSQTEKGLLLLCKSGIFFEFIPADKFFEADPPRLTLDEVELGVNYALIINSNAGLWGYSIGDTVKFVSLTPPRIIVTGRIKHFISAFGEHVIAEEVEKAMHLTCEKHPEVELREFTVAPQVNPDEGLPRHEWYISFAQTPNDPERFATDLDGCLRELNSYYDDLVKGAILRKLVIFSLPNDAFITYMKSVGKLGGQNKVPRLSNDRKIADKLKQLA